MPVTPPSPSSSCARLASTRGFQWWYDTLEWRGDPIAVHSAVGNGGQRVIVIPALDLVVALFAGLYESPLQGPVTEAVLRDYVLPAVRDTERAR